MAEGGSLASILVRITADAEDFVKDLKRASTETKAFLKAGTELNAAGAAILGTFTAMTEHAASFGSEIYLAQQRTGIAAEELSGLRLAAEAAGHSIDDVTTGFRKLAQDAENAANGQKEAVELFQKLGISATDASGNTRALSDIFHDASNALALVSNSTDKAALATQLFGRGGLALLPILAGGTAAIGKQSEEAKKAGVSVTDAQAQQARAFELAQHEAEQALNGITMTIGNAFLPAMTNMAHSVSEHLVAVREWIAAYPQLTSYVSTLGLALAGGGSLLVALAAVTGAIGLVTAGLGGMATAMAVATGGLSILIASAYVFRNDIAEIETLVGSKLATAFSVMAGSIATAAGAAGLSGLHDRMMDMKFSLEETSKGWKDMSEQFSHDVPAVTAVGGAVKGLAGDVDGLSISHNKASKEAESFAKAVQELVERVTEETKKGPELVAALTQLENQHVSMDLIVNRLGKDTIEYAATLDHLPDVIKQVVDAFNAKTAAMEKARDTIRELTGANRAAIHDALEGNGSDAWSVGMEQRTRAMAQAGTQTPLLQPGQIYENSDIQQIIEESGSLDAMIPPMVGAGDYGKLPSGSDAKQANADAKEMADIVKGIQKDAGHIFDDMFLKGKSVFQSLADFFKSTFQTMLRNLFEKSVSSLFQDILGGLGGHSGSATGGSGGSSGGLFGSIAKGVIGIFGHGGGGGQSSDGTYAGDPGTAVTGGGSGGILGSFSSFMGGPWGAAVGIGVSVLGGLLTGLFQHHEVDKAYSALQVQNAQTLWFNTTNPYEAAISKLTTAVNNLEGIPPGQVVQQGLPAAAQQLLSTMNTALNSNATMAAKIGGTLLESPT